MHITELLNDYFIDNAVWDEMCTKDDVRQHYAGVMKSMQQLSIDELNKKEEQAKRTFMSQGITLTVYKSGEGIEKIFPFDFIPRIITSSEWELIERGIK